MSAYKVFWGDSHHHMWFGNPQNPQHAPVAETIAFASTFLDFFPAAYYTPLAVDLPLKPGSRAGGVPASAEEWKGIRLEKTRDPQTIARDWAELQEATAALNRPGRFVTFPGYEWQGDGAWGDHNVIYKTEGLPVYTDRTLPELYERLRGQDALAIPHHIGYCAGIRAPRWEYCDPAITPYAEIFSNHGCSETDEDYLGLRNNPHMGPCAAGSTYQDALDKGLHLGAICSTDNWEIPGAWGVGLMACQATELTREALWDAFCRRRVYGVTGDRIELDFTCNDQPMGSILAKVPERHLQVSVRGQDAIDRIEILRNGRVIATYCHQGKWNMVPDGTTAKFKLRIEAGWGPRPGEVPTLHRDWFGNVCLSQGRFVGWSPCWITRGQEVPVLDGASARFKMRSRQALVPGRSQGAVVLEFESSPSAEIGVELNGQAIKTRVGALAQGSQVLWYRQECHDLLREMTGIVPEALERGDPFFYHYAFKARVHRIIPEAGYTASFAITDTDQLAGSTNYRVRVEQRNGQRAWSSPIWVEGQ